MLTALSFLLVLLSCQKEPTACISVESRTVNINEGIAFTNCSVNGYAYDWEVNGQTLTSKDITLTFNEEGTYEVSLTAYSKNGKKKSTTSEFITAIQPTGSISFWQSGNPSYGITEVTIDGQMASITSNYPNGINECGVSGTASFTLKTGTYNFNAEEKSVFGETWSGTVIITQNQCLTLQLQ